MSVHPEPCRIYLSRLSSVGDIQEVRLPFATMMSRLRRLTSLGFGDQKWLQNTSYDNVVECANMCDKQGM